MSSVQDVLSRGRHYDFTGKIHSGGGFMGVKMNHFITSRFFRQTLLAFPRLTRFSPFLKP
jgi:hypothetical protein